VGGQRSTAKALLQQNHPPWCKHQQMITLLNPLTILTATILWLRKTNSLVMFYSILKTCSINNFQSFERNRDKAYFHLLGNDRRHSRFEQPFFPVHLLEFTIIWKIFIQKFNKIICVY
jgi:hypothetical protein